jgi:hypothetical protein
VKDQPGELHGDGPYDTLAQSTSDHERDDHNEARLKSGSTVNCAVQGESAGEAHLEMEWKSSMECQALGKRPHEHDADFSPSILPRLIPLTFGRHFGSERTPLPPMQHHDARRHLT